MPYYEYRCEACNHEIEAKQRITDAPLVECPACGTDGLKRLISATSFVLKGGGWYVTDYADKKKAPPAGDSAGAGKAGDSSAGGAAAGASADKAKTTASPSGGSASGDGAKAGGSKETGPKTTGPKTT